MNVTKRLETMSLAKKIETINFQIDTFANGRADLQDMAWRIKGEWAMEEDATTVVHDNRRAQLNRVLHATRAFDTGLRMFLDKFGKRSANSHSISDYVGDLQRNAAGFRQLSGTVATKIKDEVTNKRNTYCHASGAFPTKQEANFVITKVLDYYTLVLGLEK